MSSSDDKMFAAQYKRARYGVHDGFSPPRNTLMPGDPEEMKRIADKVRRQYEEACPDDDSVWDKKTAEEEGGLDAESELDAAPSPPRKPLTLPSNASTWGSLKLQPLPKLDPEAIVFAKLPFRLTSKSSLGVKQAAIQGLFSELCWAQEGPVRLVVRTLGHQVRTVSHDPKHVWGLQTGGDDAFLWQHVLVEDVLTQIQAWLARLAEFLAGYARAQLDAAADMDKSDQVPYRATLTKATKTLESFGSTRFMDEIRKLLIVKLRDDTFEDLLDASKVDVSFANGIVNLETLTLRPRSAADYLTYALPYAWDPTINTERVEAFFASLMPEAEALEAMQTMLGYCFTGKTNRKFLLQITAHKDAGKSTLLFALLNAMGKYMSLNEVPLQELSEQGAGHGSGFKDGLSLVLRRFPRVRFAAIDETAEAPRYDQPFINNFANGQERTLGSLPIKHKGPSVINFAVHVKFAVASNHLPVIRIDADGLIERTYYLPLKNQFVDDPSPALPFQRKRDRSIELYLQSEEARPALALWLAIGAQRALQGAPISCAFFKGEAMQALVKTDPYLKWLADKYTPTGEVKLDHRVALEDLVAQYRHDNRDPRTNAAAFEGMRAVLHAMRGFLLPAKWSSVGSDYAPQVFGPAGPPGGSLETAAAAGYVGFNPQSSGGGGGGILCVGVWGLRLRQSTDLEWVDAVPAAKLKAAATMTSQAAFHVHGC